MSGRGARMCFLALAVIAAGVMCYFAYQTATLRARLSVLHARQAGLERDLARTEALLARVPNVSGDWKFGWTVPTPAPNVPVAPCPAACPSRVVPTLAEVEREFGLGSLDCRTMPRSTP